MAKVGALSCLTGALSFLQVKRVDRQPHKQATGAEAAAPQVSSPGAETQVSLCFRPCTVFWDPVQHHQACAWLAHQDLACALRSELFSMSCLYAHLPSVASCCSGRSDSCLTSPLSALSSVALCHGHVARVQGLRNLVYDQGACRTASEGNFTLQDTQLPLLIYL